ncbi:protein of unknown function [Shewanella benthica]|uniref:Uncharacterized protein n=1 Tax=Shewanella benthica TaxID=43661 RepID=A0A330LWA0_9GAMM|nr:hypothetical protein [Shewanella benthica]SQH74151.1 protein of unknown function [Shewanella benthica]
MSEQALTIFGNNSYAVDYIADISSVIKLYQRHEVKLSAYYMNNPNVSMKVNLAQPFLKDATSGGFFLRDVGSVWSEAIGQTGF